MHKIKDVVIYVHTYILCFFVLELNAIHTLVYLCDRVGIELPKIEVRFEHLKVVANVQHCPLLSTSQPTYWR